MAKTLTVMFQEIADAIRSKKGTSEPINAQNFATEIESIETGASGEPIEVISAAEMDALLVEENMGKIYKYVGSNTETYFQNNLYEVIDSDAASLMPVNVNELKALLDATKSAKYLFNGYKGTSVDDLIAYDDTENVTNFDHIFGNCYSLNIVPRLNTSNATVLSSFFSNCKGLTVIDTLDTSNCKEFTGMFYSCSNLTSIAQLNTDNAITIMQAFQMCSKLTTIDLTSLDKISSSSGISNAFSHCYSLTKVIIRTMTKLPYGDSSMFNSSYHFTGKVNATYNPEGLKDGRIYVPDEWVSKLKVATNWSVYADCIVPLSTLEE